MATDWQLLRKRFVALVEAPTDIASLAAFRILFGLLMSAAMVRFVAKGWVQELYTGPVFHFPYPGFEWIRAWPAPWMQVHFVILAVLAFGVAVGFFYRACAALFFLGFTYVELIDQTAYLNHYYLISLVSGLLILLPAHRSWSIDAWRNPRLRAHAAPGWCLNLLRFQFGLVYFFAGLAKVNTDWLFRAEPLRIWLAARSDMPLIGSWLNQAWVAYTASWSGALFDLSIVPLLLWRRTRRIAYAAVVVFHVATGALFNIGMFPWIMMVGATVFFAATWPRLLLSSLRKWRPNGPRRSWNLPKLEQTVDPLPTSMRHPVKPAAWVFLCSYVALQVVLPFRPYFVRQNAAWTSSGFNCAWQVMIVEKTGYAEFFAFDPSTGKKSRLSVNEYLTPRQQVMMAQDPWLVRIMARRLAADLRKSGRADVQIRVNAFATLNGRPSQPIINPDVDLAADELSNWIVGLRR